jgi:hypothetical protein
MSKMVEKVRKLQAKVTEVEKTGDTLKDAEGTTWEKSIFSAEIIGFSKRTPNEVVPKTVKSKKVKLVRFCCYDWHYKLGIKKTLEPDETEAVLAGKPTETVYW